MEIKDKVIIITGASQGIGEATAKLLAGKGAKVVLAARSKDLLEKLAKELPNTLVVPTDMRKPEDITNLIKKTLEKYGRIDILINNAGQGMQGPLESINLEKYRQIMELNVFAVVRAMQAVIPVMRKQGSGAIVNVSSRVSKMYIPNISAYASTKYALNALSLTAREELAKDHIIVSVVHPYMTATNFFRNSAGGLSEFAEERGELPEMDLPGKVAEKIAEIIVSERAEIEVK